MANRGLFGFSLWGQHYKKGIIQRAKVSCDPNWLDHAVLIVGFGEGKPRLLGYWGPLDPGLILHSALGGRGGGASHQLLR